MKPLQLPYPPPVFTWCRVLLHCEVPICFYWMSKSCKLYRSITTFKKCLKLFSSIIFRNISCLLLLILLCFTNCVLSRNSSRFKYSTVIFNDPNASSTFRVSSSFTIRSFSSSVTYYSILVMSNAM